MRSVPNDPQGGNDLGKERSGFAPTVVFSGLLWMFFFGLLMLGFGYYTRDTVALITNGIETIGKITSYDSRRCGSRKRRRICHDHTILTEDLGAVTLDLHSQYEVGSKITVTYEADNKKNIHAGRQPTLSTLDGLQYGVIGLLALSSTMFVVGWHGAVTGLGLTRGLTKMIAYPFFLGLVLSVYVWAATAISGTNSFRSSRLLRRHYSLRFHEFPRNPWTFPARLCFRSLAIKLDQQRK